MTEKTHEDPDETVPVEFAGGGSFTIIVVNKDEP
jgi:tRNA G37 N-methylase Trm5